jgi:hypothetical protein
MYREGVTKAVDGCDRDHDGAVGKSGKRSDLIPDSSALPLIGPASWPAGAAIERREVGPYEIPCAVPAALDLQLVTLADTAVDGEHDRLQTGSGGPSVSRSIRNGTRIALPRGRRGQ